MFIPPRCPNEACPRHVDPAPDFCRPHGFYETKCRSHPIPRFFCYTCKKTFSRQTFRIDYGDHKPDRNVWILRLACSGVGQRQIGRLLDISQKTVAKKLEKIGRHCKELNRNLMGTLRPGAELQFDEFETYEGRRNTRPLTLGLAIDRKSRLALAARSGPIRPNGKMTEERQKAYDRDTERYGLRQSRSRAVTRNVLRRAAKACADEGPVILQTDEKTTYPSLATYAFGDRLVHEATSSKLERDVYNPLFPINHTEAIYRDLISRLRRESWLVSKRRWFLNLHLEMYMAFRNFVRPRFNHDDETPAQIAGWTTERFRTHQLLSWRQDWEELSGHPLSMHAGEEPRRRATSDAPDGGAVTEKSTAPAPV